MNNVDTPLAVLAASGASAAALAGAWHTSLWCHQCATWQARPHRCVPCCSQHTRIRAHPPAAARWLRHVAAVWVVAGQGVGQAAQSSACSLKLLLEVCPCRTVLDHHQDHHCRTASGSFGAGQYTCKRHQAACTSLRPASPTAAKQPETTSSAGSCGPCCCCCSASPVHPAHDSCYDVLCCCKCSWLHLLLSSLQGALPRPILLQYAARTWPAASMRAHITSRWQLCCCACMEAAAASS